MKRKFVKVMFLGALTWSTVTYVGCKDYDDDIDNLQTQIDANKASIAELQKFVKEGKWVKSVEPITGGFKITFNDGTPYEIVNGAKGDKGDTGATGAEGQSSILTVDPTTGEWLINGEKTGWSAKAPYIGTDGYWYCWSNKDGKFVKDSKAQGEPGTPGTPGASGADGHSPFISDGTEGRTKGYWYYWSADKKEWVKGDKATGEKGDNGYSPYIGTDGYWYFWDIEKNEWKQGAFTDATTTLTKGQDRPCWILKQGDNTVILPTADQISALKGVSIEDGVINTQDGTKEISMKYGICPEAFTFDGTEYDANQILRTETSVFYAMINPVGVDFSGTDYKIGLTDSHDKSAAYEIGSIEKYTTVKPLTRAEAEKWNKGIYKLSVVFPEDATDDIISVTADRAYALFTKDAWGTEIISDYDINISAEKLSSITPLATKSMAFAEIGEVANLDKLLEDAGVTDLSSVVQYYYQLEGEPSGVTLNKEDKTITSTVAQTVTVKVYYLAVSGERFDGIAHGGVTNEPLSLTIKFSQDKECILTFNAYNWDGKKNIEDELSTDLMKLVKEAVGASYATLEESAFVCDEAADAFLTPDENNVLVLNIKKGFVGETTAKLDIIVNDNITVHVEGTVKVTYLAPELEKSDRWYNGTDDVKVSTKISEDKKTIDVTVDATQFFTNYEAVKAELKALGGEITFELGESVTGVTLSREYLMTIDPKTYTGDKIVINTYFVYGLEKRLAKVANIRKPDWLNGTLSVPTDSPVISIADRTKPASLTSGFVWKDVDNKQMWPSMDETYYSGINSDAEIINKAQEALAVNGLKFVFDFDETDEDTADAVKRKYFILNNEEGTIQANPETVGGLSALANQITIKVIAKATSCWGGTIDNANTTLTVTLEPWRE